MRIQELAGLAAWRCAIAHIPRGREAGVSHSKHNRIPGDLALLELLVVMVIIGLLGGYVGPRYFAQFGK